MADVEQFFHVCRSAAAIANIAELTVFGAAAVVPWATGEHLSSWPSMELDIDPGTASAADLVDGSIGEGSLFAETFGVYAHGVGVEAFVAPPDWAFAEYTVTHLGVDPVDVVEGLRAAASHRPAYATAAQLR